MKLSGFLLLLLTATSAWGAGKAVTYQVAGADEVTFVVGAANLVGDRFAGAPGAGRGE